MAKRMKPIQVRITSQEKGKNKPVLVDEYKLSEYHLRNIDTIMKNAASRFQVYSIETLDGDWIAKLV